MSPTQISPQVLASLLAAQPAASEGQVQPEIPILQHLAGLDRRLLASLLVEQRFTAGELVFSEGEPGDAAYLIWAGQVGVVKGDLSEPVLLGVRGPGEVIGEMALLEGQPRMASVIALEDLRLLQISRDSFQQLLKQAPTLGLSMMKLLSGRLRASDEVRTSEVVAERQLSQRVGELEQLQAMQRELTELIVHDLRSPLSSLFGVINMLEMVLPEEVIQANRDLLNIGRSANLRLQRMLNSMLDIARLESGQGALQLTSVDLKQLIQATLEGARVNLRSQNLELRAEVAGDLPRIQGDEARLERLLANLVDNALKFTPQGGQVTVAARQAGEALLVSVSDTGPGIPPAERERVFDRFAQLGSGPSRQRGYGLGLTFCKLTVEAHGGRIWIEAGEGGKGSKFVFTLPV